MGPAVKETPSVLPVGVEVDKVETDPLAEKVIKLLNRRDKRLIALTESKIIEFPKKRNATATLFEIYALFIRKMRRIYSRFYPDGPKGVMLAVDYRLGMLNPERQARHSSITKLNHPNSKLNREMKDIIRAMLADEKILNILRKLNGGTLTIDPEPENIKFLSILAECLKRTN